MKRICAGLLALYLFMMCGCSSGSTQKNKNIMYVVDGAYNLTPQEYIDLMNQALDNENKNYPKIPDWDESEPSIEIGSFFTRLYFDTNDEGKITRISYDWQITKDQTQVNAAYFMAGLTIGMISLDHMAEIEEELDMQRTGQSSYINECDMDGSNFYYTCAGYGKYNILSISPVKDDNKSSGDKSSSKDNLILPDEDGIAIGYVGDTLRTAFFDMTVENPQTCTEFDGLVSDPGYKFLTADITFYNYTDYSQPMFDDDFTILWEIGSGDDADLDGDWPVYEEIMDKDGNMSYTTKSDKQMPTQLSLGIHQTRTELLLFQVPEDIQDFYIAFREVFDDSTDEGRYGDIFYVRFSA